MADDAIMHIIRSESVDTGVSVTGINNLSLAFCLLLSAAVSEHQALPIPVQSALNYRKIPHQSLSVYVESLDSGDVVLSWNEAEPRNPASVEKNYIQTKSDHANLLPLLCDLTNPSLARLDGLG